MRSLLVGGVGLALALWASHARAQDLIWRPATASQPAAATLGRPQPIPDHQAILPVSVPAASLSAPRPIIRGQSPDLPNIQVPPPPPPGSGGGFGNPAVFPGGPASGPVGGAPGIANRGGEEVYNCGLVNNNADQGSFFVRTGERFRRCWTDITESVSGGVSSRTLFQSDHEFDSFISPVSNPIFFEDPRALTEFRPVFIWQHTRDSNPIYAGGNNYFAVLQGRVALTPWISLVVSKFGWTFNNPDHPIPGIEDATGLSELHLGPKVTFIRNMDTGTVAALGLNFEIASGSSRVAQDTGSWSLTPYFSIAQNFWRTSYGSFNIMSTSGFSIGIDSQRTDFLYSSVHLDYHFQQFPKIYPLVELNWTRYVSNGSARALDFEGSNLFNFGSDNIKGQSDVTLAVGARYKFSERIQFGLAGEFNLLGGNRHMDSYRINADMIFRY